MEIPKAQENIGDTKKYKKTRKYWIHKYILEVQGNSGKSRKYAIHKQIVVKQG